MRVKPENVKNVKFEVGIYENFEIFTLIVSFGACGLARYTLCVHFGYLSIVIHVMVPATENVENRVFVENFGFFR